METELLIERLKKLLNDLDVDFQERGLHLEETSARTLARELVSLDRVYQDRFHEHLFAALTPKGDVEEFQRLISEMARARVRLHDLEGDRAGIDKLLFACQQMHDDLKKVEKKMDQLERDIEMLKEPRRYSPSD